MIWYDTWIYPHYDTFRPTSAPIESYLSSRCQSDWPVVGSGRGVPLIVGDRSNPITPGPARPGATRSVAGRRCPASRPTKPPRLSARRRHRRHCEFIIRQTNNRRTVKQSHWLLLNSWCWLLLQRFDNIRNALPSQSSRVATFNKKALLSQRELHDAAANFNTYQIFHRHRLSHVAPTAPEENHHRVIATALRPPAEWRRPVGRSRTTWLRTIDDDLQSLNFGVHTAWRKA